MLAYAQIHRDHTVFHVTLRLRDEEYLPQYQDLTDATSLDLIDRIIILTREMHRQKFGEYFFRTVVFMLAKGLRKATLVSLAILLEPNPSNLMDIHTVWRAKASTGLMGEWKFSSDDYLIKGIYLRHYNAN